MLYRLFNQQYSSCQKQFHYRIEVADCSLSQCGCPLYGLSQRLEVATALEMTWTHIIYRPNILYCKYVRTILHLKISATAIHLISQDTDNTYDNNHDEHRNEDDTP